MTEEQVEQAMKLADAYAEAERSIEQEFERGTCTGAAVEAKRSAQLRAELLVLLRSL